MRDPARRTPAVEAESRVVRALADAATVEEAANEMLAAVAVAFGWDVALLWLPDAEAELLRCGRSWSVDDGDVAEFCRINERLTFARDVGLPGRVWSRGELHWVGELSRDPSFPRAGAAARSGLRSAVAIPVAGSDRVLGVVELLSRDLRPHEPDQETALLSASRQLAHFVAHVRAEERLRASEERSTAIFEAALDCVITMDHRGRVLDFNAAAESTFGHSRAEASGRALAELIVPPELRAAHRAGLERYLATGEGRILNQRLELEAMRSDGTRLPVELTVTRLGSREPPVFAGFLRDITPRRHAEEERRRLVKQAVASRASEEAARVRAEAAQAEAEADRARMAFLARVGLQLASSMDYAATLKAVARVAVPEMADSCGVTMLERGGRLRPLAVAYAGGEREVADAASWPGVTEALETGEPQLLPEVDALGVRSSLTVPIATADRTLGVIALGFGESGRRYGADDLVVARALAARAGLHVENARLYTERSEIADTLQQSLLPAVLPAIPGVEVAARYSAAGDQNHVGGDFYDVFASEEGAWTAIIGDVSGKGAAAAALTGLARHTLYAAALRGGSPARNLAFLNDAMRSRTRHDSAFCTVVYARVCPSGDAATVTLAAGGHPPPLVLRADGSVSRVEAPGTLVGVLPEATFEERELRLERGDLLLLYTDGATELRRGDLAFGERELERVLGESAGRPADAVVEAVARRVQELQAGVPADDVALLALRVSGG